MQTIGEKIAAMRNEMRPLMETAMTGVLENARGMLPGVDREKVELAAKLNEERATANTDIAAERPEVLAEVQAKKDVLARSGSNAILYGGDRRRRRAQHRRPTLPNDGTSLAARAAHL
jgi:hypothetical protein